jgi:hypothetical protein
MNNQQTKLRVISLGAGVQSTTLALMAAYGEIGPMPDCAIFADTGWEPKSVYDHLNKLQKAVSFPIYIVSAGNLRDDLIKGSNSTGGRFAAVPWFTANGGMSMRQCTNEYKLVPIRKKLRKLLGYSKGQHIPANSVEVWIGISTDEIQRMKDARDKWQVNRWPLIETRMSRQECIKWLKKNGWDAPKSACIGCPYHSDAMWRDMKLNDPISWNDAVLVDRAIRNGGSKWRHEQFMHRSLKPLDEVDLSTAAERGQVEFGFIQECDGMCGV